MLDEARARSDTISLPKHGSLRTGLTEASGTLNVEPGYLAGNRAVDARAELRQENHAKRGNGIKQAQSSAARVIRENNNTIYIREIPPSVSESR